MIELSEEWLNDVARRAADEEEEWSANRPTWLDLEDEPSALVEGSRTAAEAATRWAAKFPALAKHRPHSDIRSWREAGARQPVPVFPLFTAVKQRSAA
jgi:hypothetical protein